MSHYDLDQFVKLWAQERMTAEQAIGQILLHLREIARRLQTLERQSRRPGTARRREGESGSGSAP